MAEPIGPIFTGLKAGASLLGRARRRDEVRNLIRASWKEMRLDPSIPEGHKGEIRRRVRALPVDPDAGDCLRQLLQTKDPALLERLRQRATTLLERGASWDAGAVADALIRAVDNNLVGAKSSVQAAVSLQAEHDATLTRETHAQLREHGALLSGIGERVASIEARLSSDADARRASGSALQARAGSAILVPSVELQRWIGDLQAADPQFAADVGARMTQQDTGSVVEWLREDPTRLEGIGLDALVPLGRILISTGQAETAMLVFERAAALDPGDPARQLVRAANAANAAGDQAGFESLLTRARAMGGEGHPAVALAEVRRWKLDPAESLRRLDEIEPVGPIETAALETTKAQVHLQLEDWEAADAAIARALKADAKSLLAREVRAVAALVQQQQRISKLEPVDQQVLQGAGDEFLALRDELIALSRFEESGHLLARAAEARFLAGNADEARRLLSDGVVNPSELEEQAALRLGEIAVLAGAPDRALELIDDVDDSDAEQLVRAEATLSLDDHSTAEAAEAVSALDALLASGDEEVRTRAALGRLLASAFPPGADWSEDAEGVVREVNPVIADLLRARDHQRRGEWLAAETIYLTYGGDVRARRGLVEIAAEQEHWATALARQDAVLALDEGPEEQLRRARILRSLERRDEALSLFKAVAKDIAAPIGMRSTGYRSATELLQTGDPARVIRMATDWLEVEPDADDAHWVRAWARLRACEFDEALRELGSAGIEPATLEQARLLATLLVQSHEYPDAIRRLTEISDRFERPEDLEAAVFFGALRREGELAPELTARVRETFDEFPMRFPDSKQIIAFEVPDDPAEFRRFVEDMLPDRSPAIDVERSVLAGEAPMAALAAAVGKTASEVWALSHALPLGFSHELIDNLELEDARSALGQPVVVDVSSVSVLALIDEQTSGRCLGALPASLITESALQDCVSGASTLSRADRQAGSLTRDPITGEGLFIEADPDELEERRRLLERAAVMARELQLRADTDPDSDEPLNRQLIEERAPGATSSAFRAILSTASLAKRAERPVLCDDRWLRSALRQMGVPTFGTPALLRALGERGVVLPLEVAAARAALLARGSLGLRPSAPELLDRVGPSGNASAALASLVADRFAWIHGGDARYPVLAGFLHRCWQADPAALARWVRWALNVLKNALPEEAAARHPFALLISAFGLLSGAGPVDVPFVRALIRALERCAGEFRYGDPVYLTLDVVAELTARQPPHVRAPLLGRLITMLPWSRQPDAFKRYFG